MSEGFIGKDPWLRRLRAWPRKMRRGTDKLPASRGSERLNRWIRAGIASFLQLLAIYLASAFVGSWVWWLYASGPDGRTITMAAVTGLVISVWAILTRERARKDERRQLLAEQEQAARRSVQPARSSGGDRPTQLWSVEDPPTSRFKAVDPTIDFTTPPERFYNQEKPGPNQQR